jgi:hypothetical protein
LPVYSRSGILLRPLKIHLLGMVNDPGSGAA